MEVTIAGLVHAYNCKRQTSISFSPCILMFGGQPKLHLFIAFGIREDAEQVKTTKYAEEMLDRLRKAYDTKRYKSHYDPKVKGTKLKPWNKCLGQIISF